VRSWIAIAAAYALALQVLLSGLAAGHFAAVGEAAASDLFVICHGAGGGSPDGQNLPEKPPLVGSCCVLCTLTQASFAILPVEHDLAAFNAMPTANVGSRRDARIIEFGSPTGQYQRGPPTSGVIFG
jgi:hypothetical protein